ncbi:ATP-binding protein [Teredinibacter purpureus]|uniref:ATP-binding protein n=1 Tax=Teredinibacter purpureus TaxID=2731756 RepID=UPI0005F8188E|nr:ATP-binding protein [Teredinibacter purpureus]
MNRAFASLYLLIIFSIIGVGWGVDKLWQSYNSEPEVNSYVNSLVNLLERELEQVVPAAYGQHVRKFANTAQLDVEILRADEISGSSLGQQILLGDLVTVTESSTLIVSYKRLPGSDSVVSIRQEIEVGHEQYFYQILSAVFYFLISLVIFFWVYPLSRDLRILQKNTQKLGSDGVPSAVDIAPHSTVFTLAQSLNGMSERIRALISTHKEMTYAVSHELRTPLARMKFALEIAATIEDRKVQARKLTSIRQDVSEMESLINGLLTYAGFEQGVTKLNLKPGDLGALIAEVVAGCRVDDIAIEYDINDELNGQDVMCEWYLVERALHNVITNAQRYAQSKITITLAIDEKDYIVLVEDDGPGIPLEDRSRVFNSFVRLRQNTNFDKSGFGLGLSIVSRIMEWHNGRAHVRESQWGGACFELRWPQPYVL